MQLTEKETGLLKDLKKQEQLCAQKYQKHSQAANDEQLRNLFSEISQTENHHFKMLCDIENGTVPTQVSGGTVKSFNATYGMASTPEKDNDEYLLNDLLAAEKHASGLYDTCIFEFTAQPVREVLNSIQKAEQLHGKQLYDYMQTNGMQG